MLSRRYRHFQHKRHSGRSRRRQGRRRPLDVFAKVDGVHYEREQCRSVTASSDADNATHASRPLGNEVRRDRCALESEDIRNGVVWESGNCRHGKASSQEVVVASNV